MPANNFGVLRSVLGWVLVFVSLLIFTAPDLQASHLRSGGHKQFSKTPKEKKTIDEDAISSVIALVLEGRLSDAAKMADSLGRKLQGLSGIQKSFLVAYAKMQAGEWSEAVKYLRECEGNYPVLEDYVLYFLSEALKRSGQVEEGNQKFAEFRERYKESVWQDCGEVQLYQPREGVRTVRKTRLKCRAEPETAGDELIQANSLISEYYYDEGLKCLEKIYDERGLPPAVRSSALDSLVDGYWKKGEYKKVIKYLKEKISQMRRRPDASLLHRLATATARAGDYDEAIEIHRRIISENPHSRSAELSRYKIAFLYMDSGRFAEAIKAYEDYLNQGGARRAESKWYVAWCYLKLKDYRNALKAFSEMEGFGKNYALRGRYWMGRIFERMGERDLARAIFSEIAETQKFAYYGFLSLERLKDIDARHAEAVESGWYEDEGSGFYVEEEGVSEPAPQVMKYGHQGSIHRTAKERVTHWDKVYELDRIGLFMLVGREIEAALASKEKGAPGTVELFSIRKRSGDYYGALVAATSMWGHLLGGLPRGEGTRRIVWTSLYPEAYRGYVNHYARRFRVEPNLIYAVMREESKFRPTAVSPAYAIGLMQIIPPTAMRLADELNEGNFSHTDLMNPAVSIRLGTFYLSKLLKMFDGTLAYAIAGYNAGEEAVLRWRKNFRGSDIDEFIEEIPYQETNNYVKNVLKSYWIYKRLYRAH